MSDRLKDLQRQRALAQEQLAWLDREITRESGTPPPSIPAPPAGRPVLAEADAEALLAQYRTDPQALQRGVKRGCFLYFFAAFGLLLLGILAFYFLHPHP